MRVARKIALFGEVAGRVQRVERHGEFGHVRAASRVAIEQIQLACRKERIVGWSQRGWVASARNAR
jgi:hypothetical protein